MSPDEFQQTDDFHKLLVSERFEVRWNRARLAAATDPAAAVGYKKPPAHGGGRSYGEVGSYADPSLHFHKNWFLEHAWKVELQGGAQTGSPNSPQTHKTLWRHFENFSHWLITHSTGIQGHAEYKDIFDWITPANVKAGSLRSCPWSSFFGVCGNSRWKPNIINRSIFGHFGF
jgi:hypothetical protein